MTRHQHQHRDGIKALIIIREVSTMSNMQTVSNGHVFVLDIEKLSFLLRCPIFIKQIDIIVLETSQEVDHRVEWKNLQEEMLRSYLATAESDLKAKQELVDIKQQRLSLAQHDLNHLNTTLSTLSTSTTSRKSPF